VLERNRNNIQIQEDFVENILYGLNGIKADNYMIGRGSKGICIEVIMSEISRNLYENVGDQNIQDNCKYTISN
jgi:hypothetical protein